MGLPSCLRLAALLAVAVSAVPVQAQQQPAPPTGQAPAPAKQADEEEQPTPAPLTVGSMAVASNAALTVESMAVDVTIDRVTYAYKLNNKGTTRLALAASVALPDLEVNNEGTTIYLLPSQSAENVVGLEVKAAGKPIFTTPHVQAIALGIDRRAELSGANIPLIPFGEPVQKALGAANPETIIKLENLGLVTPRDPSQPNAPVIGDWSLHVVHGWTQNLDPNVSTEVDVAFSPIKAVYTIDAASVAGFEALKDQACLTPQFMEAVKGLLKAKGSTVDVGDITLANDGPARWLENPPASVAIHKPTPDSLVAFCGVDAKTQGEAVVKGNMPGSSQAGGLRVLIFAKNGNP